MAQLPDIHEDDRHIDPEVFPSAMPGTPPGSNSEDEILEPYDTLTENDDGSVEFALSSPDTPPPQAFHDNLAEHFDSAVLSEFAFEYTDLVERDKESRKKRDDQYEEGLRRTGLGNDAPGGAGFAGASKVVHPMMAEACIDFESRAIKELFPASGPVKSRVWGKETPEKLDIAARKVKFLNWQMTVKMPEYRTELEQLLTQLPMGGSQYQKFWYDERLGRARTEFVPIDDVFLPYAAVDFYMAQRVTHVQHITEMEYEARVTSGLYRDLGPLSAVGGFDEQSDASKANDKIEGRERDCYNDDGLRDVYEIYCWAAFDQDQVSTGELAPYIVSVDAYTEKVLGVYRNWKEGDVRMRKLDWLVEWKFIPWRGAYAVGFPHLIGGMSAALTGSLRALLDAALINNSSTLLKVKGGRMSGQNVEVEPTQIAEIEGPAGFDDIRKMIMPMPYNPPSPVLFQLLDWLNNAGKSVIATASDALSSVGDRTPVGTTMALIEQNSHTYSAIHARLHGSQAKAIEILSRINAMFMDDQESIDELGEVIVSRQEFAQSLDICPVSDPNIFSEAQRFAQMQGVAQIKAQFPMLKWDDDALARRMLLRMRVEGIDEILPPIKKPQNLNPVAENIASMHGTPLLALPKQNHLAHLFAHLTFATDPIFGQPALAMKMLPIMLEHCAQHIGFHYAEAMAAATNFEQVADSMPTKQLEESIAHTHDRVLAHLQREMEGPMELFAKLQQAAQAMAPKPGQDPAIQATLQAAMAEIQRKTAKDNADIQYKLHELELKKQEVLQLQPQMEQMKQSVERQKNDADNYQHQITELLKNRDDNETNKIIEEMKLNAQAMTEQFGRVQAAIPPPVAAPAPTPGPDMGAMTNMLLQHILSGGAPVVAGQESPEGGVGAMVQQNVMAMLGNHSQQMADTLGQHLSTINENNQQQHKAMLEHLGRPKTVVRGPDGKIVGVQ